MCVRASAFTKENDLEDIAGIPRERHRHIRDAPIVYSTCVHARRVNVRIPNGHPREENRACRTSRRGSSCVSGSWRTKLFLWQATRESRRTRRHPCDDPRAEVGDDVGVGVGVGAVECQTVLGSCSACIDPEFKRSKVKVTRLSNALPAKGMQVDMTARVTTSCVYAYW